MSTRCLFSRGDSVESVAFDPHFQRIAISSHYGKVKVFRYQSASELVELWSHEFVDIIPRAVLFADNGNSVLVYALETGIV
jgi:WD40 repeat protein